MKKTKRVCKELAQSIKVLYDGDHLFDTSLRSLRRRGVAQPG
ncbi:MAG: hypothetical protein V8K32_13420 [Candidatus Electrothrix gigas]